jgi:hypothetical protein
MIRGSILGLILIWSTSASAVGLTPQQIWLQLWSGSGSGDLTITQSYGAPFAGSDSNTNVANGSHAQATYSVTPNSIDITYSLSRPPHNNDAQSETAQADGYVDFRVDQTLSYVLSGNMNAVDPEGRNTTQWLRLLDGASTVFESYQASHSTPNSTFTLGRQDGDLGNVLSGAISGTLLPGHLYRFVYFSRILDEPATSLQSASATGFYSLLIVPEPSTAMLVYLGLIGMTLRDRGIQRRIRYDKR